MQRANPKAPEIHQGGTCFFGLDNDIFVVEAGKLRRQGIHYKQVQAERPVGKLFGRFYLFSDDIGAWGKGRGQKTETAATNSGLQMTPMAPWITGYRLPRSSVTLFFIVSPSAD